MLFEARTSIKNKGEAIKKSTLERFMDPEGNINILINKLRDGGRIGIVAGPDPHEAMLGRHGARKVDQYIGGVINIFGPGSISYELGVPDIKYLNVGGTSLEFGTMPGAGFKELNDMRDVSKRLLNWLGKKGFNYDPKTVGRSITGWEINPETGLADVVTESYMGMGENTKLISRKVVSSGLKPPE